MSNRESIEQGRSGRAGSQASREGAPGGQPRQGSGRVEQPQSSDEREHHFEERSAPSQQGEKDHPSPHVVARNQQGFAGAGGASGSHGAQSDRSEEAAQGGPPAGDHTRHGRQGIPGDRNRR